MRARSSVVAIAATLILAACGGEGDEATGSALAGNPLVVASIDFDAGEITIRNDGESDYDTSGHWACNRPAYVELPAQTLAPGDSLTLSTSSLGLDPTSGELALYTSNTFGSSEDIIRYVQWGGDSHGRTSVAVEAGIWAEGASVDNEGSGINLTGDDPTSVDSFG